MKIGSPSFLRITRHHTTHKTLVCNPFFVLFVLLIPVTNFLLGSVVLFCVAGSVSDNFDCNPQLHFLKDFLEFEEIK